MFNYSELIPQLKALLTSPETGNPTLYGCNTNYNENLKLNEPMSLHTSFEVGGPADIFVTPTSYYTLAQAIRYADLNRIPYLILGKGSNLIVRDGGIRGIVISTEQLNGIIVHQNFLLAEAGVQLKDLSDFAAENCLSGLEFACGIPGSVGGAVYMNAGAYEGEISQVLDFTVNLQLEETSRYSGQRTRKGYGYPSTFPYGILVLDNADHQFSYRKSRFQTDKLVMLYAVFQLTPANRDEIIAKIAELTASREAKQPLEYPSAGSVFQRPQGYYTGSLIQQSNLRGYQIGGAAISEKHCGFIINKGGATASDIESLIKHVQDKVFTDHGVHLETEVKIIGEKE